MKRLLLFLVLLLVGCSTHKSPVKVALLLDCTSSNVGDEARKKEMGFFVEDLVSALAPTDRLGVLLVSQEPRWIRKPRTVKNGAAIRRVLDQIPSCDSVGNRTSEALRLASLEKPDHVFVLSDMGFDDPGLKDVRVDAEHWANARVWLAFSRNHLVMQAFNKVLPPSRTTVLEDPARFDFEKELESSNE